MKNKDVAEDFANGLSESKTENMFLEKNVVYSYGYHFPIAIRLQGSSWGEFEFIYNQDGYSSSTSRHKSLVMRAINQKVGSVIKVGNTQFLKDVISKNITTTKEFVAEFGLELGQKGV